MASSPKGSPPSPSVSSPPPSPVYDSAPPPQKASPPPKSSPPPEESKSSPPPSSSSSSSSPPPSPPLPPPPPPPPTTTTPTPPSSSSTKSPLPPSPTTPLPPPPLSNNSGSKQNNDETTSPIPPPPSPSAPPPKLTSEKGSPRLSPPPPKSHSSASNVQSASESSETSSLPSLPIIIGASVGVCLLLILILALIIAICNRKKKKSKFADHIQYYNNPMPPKGGVGYGNGMTSPATIEQNNMNQNNGYQANDHLVVNLPPPPGGNAGQGGWQQTPSPQGHTQNLSSSDEVSSDLHGQTLGSAYPSPLGLNQGYFSYEELAVATQGFSQANLLGQGGFGFVHKGVLPNSKEVAVKSLKSGSGQGEREFQAEVEIISRVHHRHLVSLVGYSMAGEKKLLVYEFLPNNTLEFHLHEKSLPPMDWPTRLKIALGAAKGLAYLHEDCHPRIIHRDIKSANILLDFSFEAKVADFGLAKLTQDNNTHVSTRVMGTFGYLAPEYASSGRLTDKSDVFSFGVVLLELITGRRPLDLSSDMDESLVDWARPLCTSATEDRNFSQLVDPRLEKNFVPHEMARLVACAAACVRHSARRRPKMRQIVRALEDDVSLDDLNEVIRPDPSSRFSSTSGSNDYDSSSYSADMKKFRKLALESQDYGTSSNFGNTSEYGLNPSSSSSDSSGTISEGNLK